MDTERRNHYEESFIRLCKMTEKSVLNYSVQYSLVLKGVYF